MDIIKTIHVITAFISISGFILRGMWMMKASDMLAQKWVKIVPHINDTVLLVTAVMLAMHLHQYPFVDGWLTAKFVALLLYIGLGMVALKRGKTRSIRISAFLLAIAVFGFIVAVALTKNTFIIIS